MAKNADIAVRVGADIQPLKTGLDKAGKKLSDFGKKSRAVANAVGKVGVAAIAASVAIGVKMVVASLAAVDAQAKLARQLKTSSASIATLERAAELSGISLKNIESGAKSLEVALGEASQGTGLAVETLKQLKLTADDLQGMTLDQKLLKINAAIKANIPATEQAAAASDLFGKKAGFAISQLTPEVILLAKQEVEGLGVAMSNIDSAKIEQANDSLSVIGLAFTGVSNQLTIQMAPILKGIGELFKENAMEAGGMTDAIETAVRIAVGGAGFIGNAFRGVQVIIKGLEIAFLGLKTVAVNVVLGLSKLTDDFVNDFKRSINVIIDTANRIPGIEMDRLIIGASESTLALEKWRSDAIAQVGGAVDEMHNLLMKPLPSDALDKWLIDVKKKGQEAAESATEVDVNNIAIEVAQTQAVALQKVEDEHLKAMQQKQSNWVKSQMDIAQAAHNATLDLAKTKASNRESIESHMQQAITGLMESGNKKMFKIGKVAAIASATVDGITAAISSYKAGAKIGGPVVGAAFAGASLLATGGMINQLQSQSFSGGSKGTAPSATEPSADTSSSPSGAGGSAGTLTVAEFDPSALFSGSVVRALAERLLDAQRDGVQVVLA